MASLCALCRDIDDKVDLMSKDQVKKVRRLLLDLSYRNDLYAVLIEILCGSCGTEDTVTLCLESRSNVEHLFLIGITDSHDHVLILRKLDTCTLESLVKSFVEGLCNTKAFTCGFHLRSKADISPADLLEGEYRHLHCVVICLFLESRCVAEFPDRVTTDDLGCQRYDRDSGYLADIWDGSGGTRVDLDDKYTFIIHNKLDVDHSLDMERPCELLCVFHDRLLVVLGDALRRIYGDTVAGMDTGTLDMLHDTRDQNIGTVADRIDLDLLTHDILIN